MPTPEELYQAERVLHACGVRFDGYAYAESRTTRGKSAEEWLADQRDSFLRTLIVPQDIEIAHAALFAFQRGAKEIGWFCERSDFALAGLLLFLHLYNHTTPRNWRSPGYATEWERFSAAEIEAAAAIVRRWLSLPKS